MPLYALRDVPTRAENAPVGPWSVGWFIDS
jgi:hypothetical protein